MGNHRTRTAAGNIGVVSLWEVPAIQSRKTHCPKTSNKNNHSKQKKKSNKILKTWKDDQCNCRVKLDQCLLPLTACRWDGGNASCFVLHLLSPFIAPIAAVSPQSWSVLPGPWEMGFCTTPARLPLTRAKYRALQAGYLEGSSMKGRIVSQHKLWLEMKLFF